MKPIFIARKSVLPLSLRVERRWPAIHTSPDVKSSIPERQFRRVVLPHPDGPITATISPFRTSRSRPRSAWTAPPPLSYVFTRRRATTIRSSTRAALAGVAAGAGTGMDSEDIGAVLLGRRSEEPALHERFGGFLRRPQRRNVAASRVTVHKPNAARATNAPVTPRPINAKLSMRPRKYAPGPCAEVRTIHMFSRS